MPIRDLSRRVGGYGPSGESGTLPHQRHELGANIGRPESQQVIGIDRLAQTSQQRPSPGSVSPGVRTWPTAAGRRRSSRKTSPQNDVPAGS